MTYYKKNITNFFHRIISSFPFQLIIGQIKYNQLILLSWVFPFLVISCSFGKKFGIPSLFLAPEYLNSVGSIAFLYTGLAVGSFIIAFHLSSYVVMAHRFPFIVKMSKPFYVYSLNNSIIPGSYILLYLFESFRFQHYKELMPIHTSIINLLFFLLGVLLFIYITFSLFLFFVKKVPKLFSSTKFQHFLPFILLNKINEKDKDTKLSEAKITEDKNEKTEYYFTSIFRFKVKRTGRYSHINKESFQKVFHDQHRNILIYVIFLLSFIVIRGLIKDNPILILPAGASFHIIFTIILLLISLSYIVFQHWTFLALSLISIWLGFATPSVLKSYNNSAYGLIYHKNKVEINPYAHGNFTQDSLKTIAILNKWKQKNIINNKKPKMLIVCTSGGGMKMTLWTYYALAYTDSAIGGKLMTHTTLMTGASGGTYGVAYLRELYFEYLIGKRSNYFTSKDISNLTKGILNPVFYSFSMSDWFFRLQSFKYNNKSYYKDRAYSWEEAINRNIGHILDKPLASYRKPVENAEIPIIIFSPTIENIGSQLLISSIDISYMVNSPLTTKLKNVEFRYQYKPFEADSLRFLSAIRMAATFPFVSPEVSLPGKPKLMVMDAGLNDNFGYMSAFKYLTEFKNWINKNTSGVVLLNLHENNYFKNNKFPAPPKGITRPFSALFRNWANIQEYNYMEAIQSLKDVLNNKFEVMDFTFGSAQKEVSLSWHLTKTEKQIVLSGINNYNNRKNIKRLRFLLR